MIPRLKVGWIPISISAHASELYFIVFTDILAILLTRKNSQFLVVVQKGYGELPGTNLGSLFGVRFFSITSSFLDFPATAH